MRLGVGRRHHDVARDAPVVAARLDAGGLAGVAVHGPVRRHRIGRDDVGRDHAPALLRRGLGRRRARARQRDVNRRPRLLVGLRHEADAELGHDAVLDLDVPELALEIVGRVLRPDLLDHVDGFDHHAVARVVVGHLEQLEVGQQSARADAQHEAALAHVVELRGLGRDDRRMVVGQVDDGGAERGCAWCAAAGWRRTSSARESARSMRRNARRATARRSRADRPAATCRCPRRACSRTCDPADAPAS